MGNDLYLVTVPVIGGQEPRITVNPASTDNAAFPVRRLTEIGAQFPAWNATANKVHWSMGNAHVVYDVARGRAFDDSARRAASAQRDTAGGAGARDTDVPAV